MKTTCKVKPGEMIQVGDISITAVKGGVVKEGDNPPCHQMVIVVDDGKPEKSSEESNEENQESND